MKLPGRSGSLSASGLWQDGGSSNALPANPVYDSRTGNEPLEYKATESISFVEGFESRVNDAFEAYITTDNGSGSGGNDGSGAGLYADGGYRYGFNGKENDNHISSDDYDFGARIYDGRIAKWLSVDPLQNKYPAFSPYNYVENNPVVYKDVDGRDKWLVITINDERTGKSTMISMKISDELKYEVVGQYSDGLGHGSRGEKHYYDINLNYNVNIDKNGKSNLTVSENRGMFRVAVDNSPSASSDEKWARKKMWIKDFITPDPQKQADIGEGFWLTSENAKGQGDPYAPGAKKITKIDNADAFMIMLGRGVDYAEGAPVLLNELKEIPTSGPNRYLEALAQAYKARENIAEAINMAKEKMNEGIKPVSPSQITPTIQPINRNVFTKNGYKYPSEGGGRGGTSSESKDSSNAKGDTIYRVKTVYRKS